VISKKILYILGIPVALALLVYFFNYNPEGGAGLFLPCPFKYLTGLHCPGCGSQRALHNLLHLDFAKVASYNFLFLPAVGVFLYNLFIRVHNHYKEKKLVNYIYKPIFPRVVLGLVIVFWIARNIPVKPFSFLAP